MSGKIILDSNIIIDFFRGTEYAVKLITSLDRVKLPVIVVGELLYGANKSSQTQKRTEQVNKFVQQTQVFSITSTTAQVYGKLKNALKLRGTPIPENDIWIAAIAVENGLELITRDKHFNNVKELSIQLI